MARRAPVFHIAGAGLAGLSLALALAKFGARVTVLERSDRPDPFGAGIQISPNAWRVLDALGLGEAISEVSFAPEGIDVYPFCGPHPTLNLQLGGLVRQRFGAPYLVMHRADLFGVLATACRKFANIDVRYGVRATALEPDRKGVRVQMETGTGRAQNSVCGAFIGADGVNSSTRQLTGIGGEAVYSGMVAWRKPIEMDRLPSLSRTSTSLLMGSGFHGVVYPLPHRGVFNVALFAPEEAASASARTEAALPRLPKSAERDPRIAEILNAGEGWTFWPLATSLPPKWSAGPVGLMGDAAHAMLPFQAQGAAMALEDSAILAALLAETPDATEAFKEFENLRRARVEKVIGLSRRNGQIFHMHRFPSGFRDVVMRLQGREAHLNRLEWLYGYDATRDATMKGLRFDSPL